MNSDDLLPSARHGHVLLLILNRPGARDVIITGAGDQALCAGADLKALVRGEALAPASGPEADGGFAGLVTHPITKPLIAAVNGAAPGG